MPDIEMATNDELLREYMKRCTRCIVLSQRPAPNDKQDLVSNQVEIHIARSNDPIEILALLDHGGALVRKRLQEMYHEYYQYPEDGDQNPPE